jgi:DNA-binding MarR family transcriptional regulator
MRNVQEPYSDKVFHLFLSLQRHFRQYARQLLDESGLTPRDLSVLRYLLETEIATVGQVQTYLHKSPSTTSTLLSQLEGKGYVTRTRSEKDNRVVIIELTSPGHDLAENIPLGGLPLLRRRLGQLNKARLAEIESVLMEIIQLMEIAEDQ